MAWDSIGAAAEWHNSVARYNIANWLKVMLKAWDNPSTARGAQEHEQLVYLADPGVPVLELLAEAGYVSIRDSYALMYAFARLTDEVYTLLLLDELSASDVFMHLLRYFADKPHRLGALYEDHR